MIKHFLHFILELSERTRIFIAVTILILAGIFIFASFETIIFVRLVSLEPSKEISSASPSRTKEAAKKIEPLSPAAGISESFKSVYDSGKKIIARSTDEHPERSSVNDIDARIADAKHRLTATAQKFAVSVEAFSDWLGNSLYALIIK